jgi:hypothetical protein
LQFCGYGFEGILGKTAEGRATLSVSPKTLVSFPSESLPLLKKLVNIERVLKIKISLSRIPFLLLYMIIVTVIEEEK